MIYDEATQSISEPVVEITFPHRVQSYPYICIHLKKAAVWMKHPRFLPRGRENGSEE